MVSHDTSNDLSRSIKPKTISCFTVSILVLLLTLSSISPVLAAEYLRPGDFNETSWSKVIDYLEYVDIYAASHGKPRPPAGAHAYLYMAYVNHSGVQMLYAGLSNITMELGSLSVTLPIQTLMMHYKTEGQQQDVVTASSYIMLLAYNETGNTVFTDSPDRNDTLFASFSMGYDLSSLISTEAPALLSKTKIIELSHPEENRWHWGMTYTNLTAIWWQMWINPNNCSYHTVPVAISVYEELTFTYDLIFDLENNETRVVSNYVIGRMTDLWVIDTWWWFLPVIVHYNNTGCYRLNNTLYSSETIHQFLNRKGISMSMIFFQASAELNHLTESRVDGQNVANKDTIISDDAITTYSDAGEKICEIDFTPKEYYTLYNHTSGTSQEYSAVPRTADRRGFAHNPIFVIHTFLMRYIPLALVHMDPPLYEQAKNNLLDMNYADCFYIVSYPTYDGYRIEHDPIFTAYVAFASALPESNIGGLIGLMIVITIVASAVVGTSMLILRRRRAKTGPIGTQLPPPPPP